MHNRTSKTSIIIARNVTQMLSHMYLCDHFDKLYIYIRIGVCVDD